MFTSSLVDRRLTPEQKALILSYAELDKDTDGTVSGLTQTKSGKVARCFVVMHVWRHLGNRVINDEDYPLLKSVRDALTNLPLGSKKVAETIDEQETDTKRDAKAKKQKSKS